MADLNNGKKQEIYLRLEGNDTRQSRIHKLLPDNLITIEQTKPPLEAQHIKRIILLSYREEGNEIRRVGFEARIRKINPDGLIVLQKMNDPAPCDLRVSPRIRLDLMPSVRAFCHEKEIQIIDMSAGGTHVVLRRDECGAPEIGTIVEMKFIFDKSEILMTGEIRRKWKDASQKDHVAIKFSDSNIISPFIY